MALTSLKELYLDELGDLYDAETQTIRTLRSLVERAHASELREALTDHSRKSRLHLERLQLIFTHWGRSAPLRACAGITCIVQEADNRLNQPATPDVRDAAIVGVARRIEHYEIAGYACAITDARRLNRLDEARLLRETLNDEERADERLRDIVEARVSGDAPPDDRRGERPPPRAESIEPTASPPESPAGGRAAAPRAGRTVADGRSEAADRPAWP